MIDCFNLVFHYSNQSCDDILHMFLVTRVSQSGILALHLSSLGVGVDIEHVRQRVGDKLSGVCSRTVGAQVGAGDCL